MKIALWVCLLAVPILFAASYTGQTTQPAPPAKLIIAPPTPPTENFVEPIAGVVVTKNLALAQTTRDTLAASCPEPCSIALEPAVAGTVSADAEQRVYDALKLLRAANPSVFDAIMSSKGITLR